MSKTPISQTRIYHRPGGYELVVAELGRIVMEAGGGLGDIAAGSGQKRIAWGQATTVAAVDTIATGLGALASVVLTLNDDPSDDPITVTAYLGDQAASPTPGSFLLKSWKDTGGTDPTPVAATTFSKKVNWIAVGL